MIRKAHFFAASPIDKPSSIITYGHKHPLTNHILAIKTSAAPIPPIRSVLSLYPRSSIIVLTASRQAGHVAIFFKGQWMNPNHSQPSAVRPPPPPYGIA